MRDLYTVFLVGGTLAGVALGYLMHPEPSGPGADAGPAATLHHATRHHATRHHATLHGGGSVPPPAETEILTDLPWEVLEEFTAPTHAPPSRTQRTRHGWLAYATLKALAAEWPALLHAAGRALDSGATCTQVLESYWHVDTGNWQRATRTLLRTWPDAGWDAREIASHAEGRGYERWAFELLDAALTEDGELDVCLVYDLLSLDAVRACARIAELLKEDVSRLTGEVALAIFKKLKDGKQRDLLKPFLHAALDQFPFRDDLMTALRRVQPDAALERARWRVAQRPDDKVAWELIAQATFDAGDLGAAAHAYQELASLTTTRVSMTRLIRIDPELAVEAGARALAGTTNDEFVGGLADAYVATGNTEAAWETYTHALRLDPGDAEWIRAKVSLDPHRALAEMAERTLNPQASDELLGTYATALAETGQRAPAFDHYSRALARDPDDGEWMQGLATCDAERALPILKATCRAHPELRNCRGALGLALALTGEVSAGRARIEKALQEKPSYLLYQMLVQADPEYGEAALLRRVEALPDDAGARKALAEHYLRRGDRSSARKFLQQVLALEPDNAHWRRRLSLLR